MIPDALDFISRGTDEQQAEYAAAQMVCSRCGKHTGNNNQGHYWGLCKALMARGVPHRKAVREMHFCCPGDCELETTVPAAEGEANAGPVKSSASPSLPQGEADTDSSDAGSVGVLASEDQTPAGAFEPDRQPRTPRPQVSPRWSAIDDETSDLLSLVASEHPATPNEVDEWTYFVRVLQGVALADGLIDQNVTRPLLRGEVAPRRIGAFYHRATKSGLIRAEGWNTSNDLEGKNGGKPTRMYRWIGT